MDFSGDSLLKEGPLVPSNMAAILTRHVGIPDQLYAARVDNNFC